jgi:hypothetical protein
MKVVVRFDPPNAHAAAREWREQHAAALSALPDEAIQIDTQHAGMSPERLSREAVGVLLCDPDLNEVATADRSPVAQPMVHGLVRTGAELAPSPGDDPED